MSVVSFFVDYCCCNYSFVGPVRIRFFVSLLFFFVCASSKFSFYILISTTIYFCTRMRNVFKRAAVNGGNVWWMLSSWGCHRLLDAKWRWGGSEESIKDDRQCHNVPATFDFKALACGCLLLIVQNYFPIHHHARATHSAVSFIFDAAVLAHEKARMLRRLALEYHPMTLKMLLYITSRQFPAFKFKEIWSRGEVAVAISSE